MLIEMNMKTSNILVLTFAALMCAANALAVTTVKVGKAGTLGSLLTREQQDTCTSLAIKGKLNSADIKVLRCMAGGEDGDGRGGVLSFLDLSCARMVSSDENYMVLDAAEEYLVCAVYAKQLEEHRYGLYSERKRFEVRKYGAAYALGHDSEEKYEVVRMSQCYCRDRSISQKGFGQSVDPYEQNVVSQFDIVFRNGVTDEEWNFLVRGKMTSFAGHRVEKQGNGYVLYCHTQKGVFSRDFFYKCPQMKMVVIPDNATLDDGIVVWHSLVPYVHKRMQGRVTVQ